MKEYKFIAEVKHEITYNDFFSLRNVYQPIIGDVSVGLYSLIYDYHLVSKSFRSYFDISDLTKVLGIEEVVLRQARLRLEAVGLLRVFEMSSNNHYIFSLNRPMSPEQLRSNKLLYNYAISKIGPLLFERAEFFSKVAQVDKADFTEITAKFQTIFELNKIEDIDSSTLEISAPILMNADQAVSSLPPTQYIFYLTGSRPSPRLLQLVQELTNEGISSHSLNLILNYSYKVNQKLVANYIYKISHDFLKADIVSPKSIKQELAMALESKLKTAPDTIGQKTPEALDWHEMFDSLGDF